MASSKNGNKLEKKAKRDYEADWLVEPSRKQALISLLKSPLRIEAKNENQRKFLAAMVDPKKTMVIGSGCAGVGKTYLALAAALNLLLEGGNDFEEIIIFKSVKMLEGEDIGFLPGDKNDKLQYIYMSYFCQLEKLVPKLILEELKNKEFIKVLPLGAIRGLSISSKSIVIVDEMQNLSVDNAHTVITRMESKSKLICIGDEFQRDRRDKNDNGLTYVTERLRGIAPSIEVIEFTKEDSVRNKLIQQFQTIYEDYLDDKQVAERQWRQTRIDEQAKAATPAIVETKTKSESKSLFRFLK